MALVPCVDCGNQISSEAWACPKCGRPTKGKGYRRRLATFWILLVAIFAAVTVVNTLHRR